MAINQSELGFIFWPILSQIRFRRKSHVFVNRVTSICAQNFDDNNNNPKAGTLIKLKASDLNKSHLESNILQFDFALRTFISSQSAPVSICNRIKTFQF